MNIYIKKTKQLRKAKKLTLLELAKKMGISASYPSRIERGKLKPSMETLETIKDFIKGRL